MREIKFRVWQNTLSFPESCNYFCDLDSLFKNPSVIPSKIFSGEDSLLIIEQWTGLKDKNGQDIYEGDIVEGFEGQLRAQILFGEEDAAFVFRSTTGGEALLNKFYLLNFTIIGNIHQHSNLLK